MPASAKPTIRAFFDEATNTASYLVSDPATRRAVVIDPVLDYDQATGTGSTRSADAILEAAKADGLTIEWVLETHAHADHLSGAPYIKLKTGAKVGIGEHIREVQKIFRPVFNATDVRAKCSCSRDAVESMLKSFSQDDRDHMVEYAKISVTCEFCSATYQFAPADVGANEN